MIIGGSKMPLIKCPDCEKMISDRVESCPFCGCPSSFFLPEKKEPSIPNNSESMKQKDVDSLKNDTSMIKPEETIDFRIGSYILKYPKGSEKYAAFFGGYLQLADIAYEEMLKLYREADSIVLALRNLPNKAEQMIFNIINEGTKFLYSQGINITPEQFMAKYARKYVMDYESYYDVIVEEYSEIIEKKKELEVYREAKKASRGRWQGGGFGVQGAIKGAITASAMNLGTDFLHSFGDSAIERSDNKLIQDKLRKLYNSSKTKAQLCHSVKTCILNVYKALNEELQAINYYEAVIDLQKEKANTLYETTKKYETNSENIKKNMIQCIYYYPGDRRYYDVIKDELLFGENDIHVFLKFWNLEYLISDILNQKMDKDDFDNYMIECGGNSFDFTDYSATQMAVLLEWLCQYGKVIPSNGQMARTVTNYLRIFAEKEEVKEIGVFEWIPQDINVHDFLQLALKIEKLLSFYVLNIFWFVGHTSAIEPTEKIEKELSMDGDVLRLYCDTSLLKNGGKGLAITGKYVLDLQSKEKIEINKVRSIEVDSSVPEKNTLVISSKSKSIIFTNNIVADCNISANILKNILTLLFVRYANNEYLWNESMLTEKPVKDISKKQLAPGGYYRITEPEMIEKGKEYCDYIKRYSECYNEKFDLKFANEFRRRIKRINSFWDDTNIYKYDYEVTDGNVLEVLGENNISGQYLLYYDGINLLTDQNFYLYKNRISLKDIYEILLYNNLGNKDNYIIYVSSKKGKFKLDLKKEDIDKGKLVDMLTDINIALENLREPHCQLHYDKDDQYYCGKCQSLDVKLGWIGPKCNTCNNSTFDDFYELVLKIGIKRKCANGYGFRRTEDEKKLFYDENLHCEWMNSYSEELGAICQIVEESDENLEDKEAVLNNEKKEECIEVPLSENIDFNEQIEYMCEELKKKLYKAREFEVTDNFKMTMGIADEKIYLGHDDSLFKNGKNGYVITNKGIFCREIWSNKTIFTSFTDLANTSNAIFEKDGRYYADNNLIAYHVNPKNKNILIDFLENIRKISREMNK